MRKKRMGRPRSNKSVSIRFMKFALVQIHRSPDNLIMADLQREFIRRMERRALNGRALVSMTSIGPYAVEMRKCLEHYGYILVSPLNQPHRAKRPLCRTEKFPKYEIQMVVLVKETIDAVVRKMGWQSYGRKKGMPNPLPF